MVWLSPGLGLLVVVVVVALAVFDLGSGGSSYTEQYSAAEGQFYEDLYGSGLDEGLVTHQPADAESSIASIRAVYEAAFDPATAEDEWLQTVDAPVEVGEELRTLADGCGTSETVVEDIVFVSDDAATVFFHFAGTPGGVGDTVGFSGTAERNDGAWQVSRYTIDKVVLNASPVC